MPNCTINYPSRRKLSVPMVARMMGIAEKKVLDWIRSGELRAINLAQTATGRPRYAVDVADIEAFERARQVVPSAGKSTTRKLRPQSAGTVKKFF